MEYTHITSADDISLGGQEVVTALENRGAIQRILNKLEDWADGNLMTVNRDECEALQAAQNNPCNNRDLGLMGLGTTLWKATVGINNNL